MSFSEIARPTQGWLRVWYDARARSNLLQILFVAVFAALAVAALLDVRGNMQARGIPTDFSFLGNVAGFDINQSLIPYSAASTYGRAFLVGLLNTCLVGALGVDLRDDDRLLRRAWRGCRKTGSSPNARWPMSRACATCRCCCNCCSGTTPC